MSCIQALNGLNEASGKWSIPELNKQGRMCWWRVSGDGGERKKGWR